MTKDLPTQATGPDEPASVPAQLQNEDLGSAAPVPNERPADSVAPAPEELAIGLPEFLEDTHTYVREYISLADQKAAFIFAVVTAMLVYVYGEGALSLWFFDPRSWDVWALIAFLSSIGLLGAAASSVLVVWPRLGGASAGFVFWKAIVAHNSAEEFVRRLENLSDQDLAAEKAKHLFEMSEVCSQKYQWVNLAISLGSAGMLASILLVIAGLN